jgi:hypothetical protein
MRHIPLIPPPLKNSSTLATNVSEIKRGESDLGCGHPRTMIFRGRDIHNWQKLTPEEKGAGNCQPRRRRKTTGGTCPRMWTALKEGHGKFLVSL